MKELSPCANCDERYTACHDQCELYRTWKDKVDAKRSARQEFLKKESESKVIWSKSYRDRVIKRRKKK